MLEVAAERMVGAHEVISERELVGCRAAEPNHAPDVVHCTSLDGTSMTRSIRRPPSLNRGVPSAWKIGAWQPIQVACRPPDANAQVPVTR